ASPAAAPPPRACVPTRRSSDLLIPVRSNLQAFVGELSATPGALEDTGPWFARLYAIATKAREAPATPAEPGEDRVATITRLTIAADFAEALKQVMRGLDALRFPVSKPSRERQLPALVVHRDYHA